MSLEQVHQGDMELDFPFSSEREDWIQSMIAGGLGTCLLTEFLVEASGVRTRRVVDPPLERSVEIAYCPEHENSHGLMALLDHAGQVSRPVMGENWERAAR
jgi:DNA-binding transcriptional LysR family regulator